MCEFILDFSFGEIKTFHKLYYLALHGRASSSSSSWLWLLAEFSKWPYLCKLITLVYMRNIQVQLEHQAANNSDQRRQGSMLSSTVSSPASSQA